MSENQDFVINGVILTKYQGPGGDVTIPNGVEVIGDSAFQNCTELTGAVIPEGVREIRERAFFFCTSLAHVSLPASLEKIGGSAFQHCAKLTSLEIPEGVREIGWGAFSFCVELTRAEIPEGVREIQEGAFSGCAKLTRVRIPAGVTKLDAGAFDSGVQIQIDPANPCYLCQQDLLIDRQEGALLRYLGDRNALEQLTVPEGVKRIEKGVFAQCEKLKTVLLPDSLEEIGFDAFNGCKRLTDLSIPKNVKKIGAGAFSSCAKLVNLTIWPSALDGSQKMFGGNGKTMPMTLLREDQPPLRVMACFRRDYYVQKWSYGKDVLVPLEPEAVPFYDSLAALGEYDGFKMKEDSRIRAMLWRLQDKERPAAAEARRLFAGFLSKNLNKAVKYAQQDGDPSYLQILWQVGAVPEQEKEKFKKRLAASKVSFIREMAEKLEDGPAEPVPEEPADSRVEKKYLNRLRKLNAKAVLLKWSTVSLPEIPLAEGGEAAPKEYLQLILAEYLDLQRAQYPRLAPMADQVAAKLDRAALQKALLDLYEQVKSDKARKAMVPALCRYADGATVTKIYRQYADNKREEETACWAALYSDTREAMLLADKNNWLDTYAAMRGTDADTLRDTRIAQFGLDEKGEKVYDLGGNQVTVSLNQQLKLTLYDHKGEKTVKSLPKRGADPEKHAAAQADLAEMRKNLKKAAKGRCDNLFQQFLSGQTQPADRWKAAYLANPLLRQIASLLVWSQGGKTFTLLDGQPADSAGGARKIGDRPIKLAHPMEMKGEDTVAWQKYFASKGIQQPFAQVWEPVIDFQSIRPDRYSGVEIPAYRFKGQEKHGISFEFSFDSSDLEISLEDCRLEYDPWNGGQGAVSKHFLELKGMIKLEEFRVEKKSRQANHIVGLLDKWTVYNRIAQGDVSVVQYLDNATLAQVTQYLNFSIEQKQTSVTAELLNYKNQRFPDFDPMEEFTLEDF